MVTTFELEAGEARLVEVRETMGAASAALPEGAYTSFRTYDGNRVLRLGQHVRRLVDSVALQGRPGSLAETQVRTALARALDAGRPETRDARLRLTFAPPRLFASIEPFEPPPAALYRDGAFCVTVPVRRENPHSKDTRFLAAASGAYRSLPPGAHEGLMVAEDGALLEGLSSNFFAVRNGVLQTEEARVLLGVTRSLVLEVAGGILPASRTAVRRDQLDEVAECFITSVSREVLPVVRIDGRRIGDGRPGPITRAILEAFAALVAREAEPLLAGQ